jgi:carbon monoxide dehydrogenase subunit G
VHAELTIEIERSPEDVFAYLTDVSNLTTWQDGVHRAEIVDGGEVRAGARIGESRHMLGRELHTTLEIADFDPPRVFALRALDGPVPFSVRHELEPAGEGTQLRVIGEAEIALLPGFAAGIMERRARKQFQKDFERLKHILES